MSLYVELSRKGPPKGRLYVDTEPEDARVRILNIKLRFFQGMELEPGRYHVEVKAKGYKTERIWVDLVAGHEEPFKFELKSHEGLCSKYGSFTSKVWRENYLNKTQEGTWHVFVSTLSPSQTISVKLPKCMYSQLYPKEKRRVWQSEFYIFCIQNPIFLFRFDT